LQKDGALGKNFGGDMARKKTDGTTMATRREMLAEHNARTRMNKEEINELLLLKGWTQAILAKKFDVSHVTVYYWCKGDTKPPAHTQKTMKKWLLEARKKAEAKDDLVQRTA